MKTSSFSRCLTYIEAQERAPKTRSKPSPLPAITISREAGAGANSVANRVMEILEKRKDKRGAPWTVFDQDLVKQVLKDHNLPERIHRFMPEDVTPVLSGAVEEILGLHPSHWTLWQHTVDTIFRLALMGNVIVIGRGANVVTAKMPHVFHVRLVAPRELRVRRLSEARGVSVPEAQKLARRIDAARRRYVKSHFNADITDPLCYDIVINTGRVDYDQAAEMIVAHVSA